MIEQFADAIMSILPTVASAAVIGVCGYAYNKLRGFRGEHVELVGHLQESESLKSQVKKLEDSQEAQNTALRELLGKELDKEHARLVAQGHASPDRKSAFERLYRAYHGLGGNGTRTALYEDVLKMNSYPS
mgnify:CR=1 FL=1